MELGIIIELGSFWCREFLGNFLQTHGVRTKQMGGKGGVVAIAMACASSHSSQPS